MAITLGALLEFYKMPSRIGAGLRLFRKDAESRNREKKAHLLKTKQSASHAAAVVFNKTKIRLSRFVILSVLILAAIGFVFPFGTGSAKPAQSESKTEVPGNSRFADGWILKWNPDPRDKTLGLGAFEGVEDDRTNSHAGVKHIYVAGDNYRFDMHTVDRDGSDRQRNEVKGMRTVNDSNIMIKKGETWRFAYSMFIPETLSATTEFTHVMQQKMVTDAGSSGGPVVTLSLHVHDGTPSMELRLQTSDEKFNPEHFNPIPLAPLQNKWINVEFEFKFDSGTDGYARMVVKDGAKLITDKTRTGIDLFRENEGANPRMRPKWGIYRSIKSAGLQDTYLLLTDMKAYQKE